MRPEPSLAVYAALKAAQANLAINLAAIHPPGYCPEGNVIADACVFLASEKARFVTGHIMHVSSGAEIGYRR